MSYRLSAPSRTSDQPGAFASLLPRGESLLVTADRDDADVRIGHPGAAGCQQRSLTPGTTLLVCAGSRPAPLWGSGCRLHPAGSEPARMLAFHDHAMGVRRPPPEDRRLPVVLAAACDLRDPGATRQWVMTALLGDDPAFRATAAVLAGRESYQLVRFVLENPDLGVQQLADRYGLSVAQFRRIGRKAFGRSLKEQLRLLRAGRVLHCHADTGHTFTRLSSDFGFSSPSHFCSEIKSLLGRSPRSIFQSVNAS